VSWSDTVVTLLNEDGSFEDNQWRLG